MSSYRKHAEREFKAIGYDLNDTEDGPNKWIMENLFELLEVFDKQGHSGSSAPYCVNAFKKLALFEPLGPLTGADDEWMEVSDGMWQNVRCSHVFKEGDQAYDINGKMFRELNGSCYTNRDSRVYVSFPYIPTTQYVNV